MKMNPPLLLKFKGRPLAIISLVQAFIGISRSFDTRQFASIYALIKDFSIDPDHLDAYSSICGIEKSEHLPLLYPTTLIFPLIIRMLGHKKAPLTIFKTLNTRDQIYLYRPIRCDENLDIDCRLKACKVVDKGLEVTLSSIIRASGEPAWESVKTFFYPGHFGDGDKRQPSLPDMACPKTVGTWHLPDGLGFRFARISGDTNGIHYLSWYARIFGFKRDFAQPTLVLEKSINLIDSEQDRNTPIRLDLFFKGPVYYDSDIIIKGENADNGYRFDIFSPDNPRPCICGLVSGKTGF